MRNCVIWDSSNPNATATSSLHPAKVTVWAGFTATQVLPPFFFEGTIDGDSYLAVLQDHVVPVLKKKRMLSKTTFQQDGAPPHIKKCVTDFLRANFGTRIISRSFEHTWPPRSPDLTPADFWFWGTVKQRVYQRSPCDLEELKQCISHEMNAISRDELQRSCENVLTRLEVMRRHDGRHFEHL